MMQVLVPLAVAALVVLAGAQLAIAQSKQASQSRPKAQPRTLEEINIEGQVDLPEVLFISSRERIKTQEFHHHRYRKSAQQIAESAELPRRLTTKKEQ